MSPIGDITTNAARGAPEAPARQSTSPMGDTTGPSGSATSPDRAGLVGRCRLLVGRRCRRCRRWLLDLLLDKGPDVGGPKFL
jgi:hypothetical protein